MKREGSKFRFIELRALGYTYKKICAELKISHPTAIKWGRLFEAEVNKHKKNLMANIISRRVVEEEQGLLIKLEHLRRTRKMNLPKKITDKMDKKVLDKLERIFIKRIKAIHLKIRNDEITAATFIFDDDVKVTGS